VTVAGDTVPEGQIDLVVRVVSMRRVHHACAGTGAMCTSVAARLAGTHMRTAPGLMRGEALVYR
jgi:2-methylaconitate cis-trans-isomerase PrpF